MSSRRNYSKQEILALNSVWRTLWRSTPPPKDGGPAQYACGTYWPDRLLKEAEDMERLIPKFRLAAEAMRREQQKRGEHE
jgi:hypothetical protein